MLNHNNIPSAVARSLQRHFPNQRLLGFETTMGGFSNWTQRAVLEGQQLIVKAASNPHKRLDLRREASALQNLLGIGLPIAPLYALDEYEHTSVALLGYLPGVNGLRLLEQQSPSISTLYQQLAQCLAQLHASPLPQHPLLAEPIAQRASTAFAQAEHRIPAALQAVLVDGLQALHELPTIHLIHGDPGAHNLLWDGKLTALLDWEWAGAGHALIDLAWLKWTLRFRKLGEEIWNAICVGYGTMPAADEGLMQRLAFGQMAAIIARLNDQPTARTEWLRRVAWTANHQ